MSVLRGARLHITGIVQGVGFRPFVYGLATRLSLTGWVRNTSSGVDIELDGTPANLKAFIHLLQADLPSLARIDSLQVKYHKPNGFTKFEISPSVSLPGEFQPISPDVSVCADCLEELFDPNDRRYRYPFINCTNCGPRFTIITDIPYDRPNTTMASFQMCPECLAEYSNPLDRRFHAQPAACPICGPHVSLELAENLAGDPAVQALPIGEGAVQQARSLLAAGKILAIKGLGGFHLACNADNPRAVAELRRRKFRVDKPFALMMPDVGVVETHCFLNSAERELLESRSRPVVLLLRKPDSGIAQQVAPRQNTLGVMLPYTPLHYLLMERAPGFPEVLVMTSGNLSEEPIATDNDEARQRLSGLADAFLMHNRDIRTRCDDSVARVFDDAPYMLRRSRGYAPDSLHLPFAGMPLLAAGAELKNTFCLVRERHAFLSHHIGEMENYETLRSFEDGAGHFERLFRIKPEALACDRHPDYMSTHYVLNRAEKDGLPVVSVQHHHAHIAACMAENGLASDVRVLGIAFDGTGYGEDGSIWGGEFLVANYQDFQRVARLMQFPLPGGDAAIKRPARTALALLWQLGLEWDGQLAPARYLSCEEQAALRLQMERGLNAPPTSSMGRLFDAAAALTGIRQEVNYEAQAAMEFESLADVDEKKAYPFDFQQGVMDPAPAIKGLLSDLRAGIPVTQISARFHNGIAQCVVDICLNLSMKFGISDVALSGGVWQNMFLMARTVKLLQSQNLHVFIHRQVPTNDGGISLGQAAIAAYRLKAGNDVRN